MAARSSATRFRAAKLRPGLSFPVALERLRSGKVLRLEYYQGRPSWDLGGMSVAAETVALLIACGDVQPDNDTLIPGTPGQSWRLHKRVK
jgi:hypothetical protein